MLFWTTKNQYSKTYWKRPSASMRAYPERRREKSSSAPMKPFSRSEIPAAESWPGRSPAESSPPRTAPNRIRPSHRYTTWSNTYVPMSSNSTLSTITRQRSFSTRKASANRSPSIRTHRHQRESWSISNGRQNGHRSRSSRHRTSSAPCSKCFR